MRLRSGRCLESQQPAGAARRRCRPRRCCEDKVDRISILPDDLLLDVLVRHRCARASLLSRRWRGLWIHLPDLTFREVAPESVHGALARVARTDLPILDVDLPQRYKHSSAGVASLLRTAARLAPTEFSLTVYGDTNDGNTAVEIPCFHRAASINLHVHDLHLTSLVAPREDLPFLLLERLSIAHCRLDAADLNDLISRSPRLRVLEVSCRGKLSPIRVHSSRIVEIQLVLLASMEGIDIEVPRLKRFVMKTLVSRDFGVSFSAPVVEDLFWSCVFLNYQNVGIGEIWSLCSLTLQMSGGVRILSLRVRNTTRMVSHANRNLMQEINRLPNFSVLELYISPLRHFFGAMAVNVLGTCTSIKRHKVDIKKKCDELLVPTKLSLRSITKLAKSECYAYDSRTSRNTKFNLEGNDHEVDFLKFIFRSAIQMKNMTVTLSPQVLHGDSGFEKINNIFKANPSVQCSIY